MGKVDVEKCPLPPEDGGIPAIAQWWRRVWEQFIPFFAYPNEIRKIIFVVRFRSGQPVSY
jgi:hypothetical protein